MIRNKYLRDLTSKLKHSISLSEAKGQTIDDYLSDPEAQKMVLDFVRLIRAEKKTIEKTNKKKCR